MGGRKASPGQLTPLTHASSHENGGSDEISVAGLSGELADNQHPKAHKTSHENGGSDEISVAGLSGELADNQPPKAHDLGGAKHNADTLANLNLKVSDATLDDSSSTRTPSAHKTSHENGGSDVLSQLHDQNTDKTLKDADGDTQIQCEESADEDHVRMDVAGVEAFDLENNGILTLAKNSGAYATLSANQNNLSTGVVTKIDFDTETYDIQSEFDKDTDHDFTAKVAGYYLVECCMRFLSTVADKDYYTYIKKNGVTSFITGMQASIAGNLHVEAVAVIYMAVNDYLEFFAQSNAGVNTVDIGSHATLGSRAVIAKIR